MWGCEAGELEQRLVDLEEEFMWGRGAVGFGYSSPPERSKCRISAGAGRMSLEEARREGLASKFRAWLVQPQDRGFGLDFSVANAAPQVGWKE